MHFFIISDDNGFRGGAGMIANAEYLKLKDIHDANCIFYPFFKQPISINLVPLLFIKKNLVLFFLIPFYLSKKTKFIIHSWSYLPIVSIFQLFFPRNFIFVIHDYLIICPSKSVYNFKDNKICDINGYSSLCLKCKCGYNFNKKIYSLIALKILNKKNVSFRFLSSKSFELFSKSFILNSNNHFISSNIKL